MSARRHYAVALAFPLYAPPHLIPLMIARGVWAETEAEALASAHRDYPAAVAIVSRGFADFEGTRADQHWRPRAAVLADLNAELTRVAAGYSLCPPDPAWLAAIGEPIGGAS